MKFVIALTLLFSLTYQQTIFSQLQCSRTLCANERSFCFNDNNTVCSAYAQASFTRCGLKDLEDIYTKVFESASSVTDPAAISVSETCMQEDALNEDFTNFVNCLINCSYIKPNPNSEAGLLVAAIENGVTEFYECMEDNICGNEFRSGIIQTDICLNCSFLPRYYWNWNAPLTYSDAECFKNCYSSNNTENDKLKAFLDTTEHLFDDIEFLEDQQNEEPMEKMGFCKMIIAFIMKIFMWLFK